MSIICIAQSFFFSYCKNDVDILLHGLVAFRDEFRKMTKRTGSLDEIAQGSLQTTPHEVRFL